MITPFAEHKCTCSIVCARKRQAHTDGAAARLCMGMSHMHGRVTYTTRPPTRRYVAVQAAQARVSSLELAH